MANRNELGLSEFASALRDIEAGIKRANTTARFGPRGFGHLHDRTAVIDEEAAAIRDAARRVLSGETLSSVVTEWNDRGIRTATGRPWRVNSLSALLIQPRLAGFAVDDRGMYRAMWPAILDEETHRQLVAARSSRSPTRRPPRRSLLAGLLLCGRCRGHLHHLVRGESFRYYRCPSPSAGGCSGVTIKGAIAEEFARDLVLERG